MKYSLNFVSLAFCILGFIFCLLDRRWGWALADFVAALANLWILSEGSRARAYVQQWWHTLRHFPCQGVVARERSFYSGLDRVVWIGSSCGRTFYGTQPSWSRVKGVFHE